MRKKIFLRIFVLTVLAIGLVFTSGILALQKSNQTVIEKRLSVEAQLLSCMLKTEDDILQLEEYQNRDEFRITVIRDSGEVLYESSIPGVLESHSDREEVIGALKGTPHTVERYSETFDCRMTYYAVSTTLDNGEVIVIRLAVKSSEISSYLRVAAPFLLLVLAVSLGISLLFAGKLSRSLSEKVQGVAVSLRSLNEGEYRPIETDSSESEFYAVFREINELNEKTHAYILSEEQEREKLNTVLDTVSQGIVALDRNGLIAFANNSAFTLFSGDKTDIGKPLLYLIEDSALCGRLEDAVKDPGSEVTLETLLSERELSITVRPISEKSLLSSLSSLIIVTDVTKEKQIAKEKSDFFANASHELKTPITVMQGLSELLLSKDSLGDSERKQVERIHKESLRLSDLISDMLKLSSLERREEDFVFSDTDLRAIVDEVFSELSHGAKEKNVTLSVQGEAHLLADPKKLYELAVNLCSNGIKYNKDGGHLEVVLSESEKDVALKVADTGIGIEKEHLPRLCQRFYRVDKSRSKKTGGTGLGLAIVKHICALYGAELTIDSEEQVGTTVTVIFPKKDSGISGSGCIPKETLN